MNNFLIPMSPGEVLDKLTILEIKSERIDDPTKVSNVKTELTLLQQAWDQHIEHHHKLDELKGALREVNEALWEIEDGIRDEERNKRFEEEFIRLARAVYFTNDKRAAIKKEINLFLGSEIVEEKSYQDYGQ